MDFEEQILTIIKKTGLSRKEIFAMIELKKQESKKTLSDLIALYFLAKDLCIEI